MGLLDQGFDLLGLDPGVLLVADEEQHLGHRDHADFLAHGRLDPLQIARRLARIELAGEAVQQLLNRLRGRNAIRPPHPSRVPPGAS